MVFQQFVTLTTTADARSCRMNNGKKKVKNATEAKPERTRHNLQTFQNKRTTPADHAHIHRQSFRA